MSPHTEPPFPAPPLFRVPSRRHARPRRSDDAPGRAPERAGTPVATRASAGSLLPLPEVWAGHGGPASRKPGRPCRAPTARASTAEQRREFEMRRPEELVDRENTLQPVPGVGEEAGVACEGCGTAGNVAQGGDRKSTRMNSRH